MPVADCTFCGAWTLAPDVTIALQDVTLGHATLVYDAIQTITVEMAFAPEGSACMSVERRERRARVHRVDRRRPRWRDVAHPNVPEASAAKQMVIALDEQGRMVLRQPNRMDEPMVFTRIAAAEEAAAWCVARAERDAAIEAAASGEEERDEVRMDARRPPVGRLREQPQRGLLRRLRRRRQRRCGCARGGRR